MGHFADPQAPTASDSTQPEAANALRHKTNLRTTAPDRYAKDQKSRLSSVDGLRLELKRESMEAFTIRCPSSCERPTFHHG